MKGLGKAQLDIRIRTYLKIEFDFKMLDYILEYRLGYVTLDSSACMFKIINYLIIFLYSISHNILVDYVRKINTILLT